MVLFVMLYKLSLWMNSETVPVHCDGINERHLPSVLSSRNLNILHKEARSF